MRHTGCSAVSTCSSCCLDINKNRLSNKNNPHHEQDYHYLSAVLLLCSCGSVRHYAAFQYDNGDDYVSEGLYRIVDRKGRIGYADETGKTVIRPRFAFGYPFEGGKAKVTDSGERKEVAGSGGEHWYWESDDWYYIDRNGDIVGTLMQDSTRFGRRK